MEEIKVGEYVRTKGGYIAKVLDVQKRSSIISRCDGRKITYQPRYWIDNKSGSVVKSYIVKHSNNITDLIEKGDYVNGCRVRKVTENKVELEIVADVTGEYYAETISKNDIKSIVTKEQFESIKYEVIK